MSVARDGVEALAYLRREGTQSAAIRPELIVLDLDLPGKHGHEVLTELKGDQALCSIPVVVLTGSHEPDDIVRSYQLHANAYVTKPVNLDAFLSTIDSIVTFWRATATAPLNRVMKNPLTSSG